MQTPDIPMVSTHLTHAKVTLLVRPLGHIAMPGLNSLTQPHSCTQRHKEVRPPCTYTLNISHLLWYKLFCTRENVSPRPDEAGKNSPFGLVAQQQVSAKAHTSTKQPGLACRRISPALHQLKAVSCRAVPASRETDWRSPLVMKEKAPSVSGPEGKTGRTMDQVSTNTRFYWCPLTGVRTREAAHVQVDPHTGTQERDSCTCVYTLMVAAYQRSVTKKAHSLTCRRQLLLSRSIRRPMLSG